MPTNRPAVTAVVAQTKDLAEKLAHNLGIDTRFAFAARNVHLTIVGLRADRVLVDAQTSLSDRALEEIHATARKTPGGLVRFVTVW